MSGPHTDDWLDQLTPQEFDAWLVAFRKQPVARHGYDQNGYCTGCPGDVPWLACPVWAQA